MRKIYLIPVLIIMLLSACSSTPVYEYSDNVAMVKIDQGILADNAKTDAVDEYEVTRLLHRYIRHRMKKISSRKQLFTTATLHHFRLKTGMFSGGVSRMKVHVTVAREGNVIADFEASAASTKKREKAVRRMSKEIASQIHDKILTVTDKGA